MFQRHAVKALLAVVALVSITAVLLFAGARHGSNETPPSGRAVLPPRTASTPAPSAATALEPSSHPSGPVITTPSQPVRDNAESDAACRAYLLAFKDWELTKEQLIARSHQSLMRLKEAMAQFPRTEQDIANIQDQLATEMADWKAFRNTIEQEQAPPPVTGAKEMFLEHLRPIEDYIDGLQSALREAKSTPNGEIESFERMKNLDSMRTTLIVPAAQRADSLLADLYNTYHLVKDFEVTASGL